LIAANAAGLVPLHYRQSSRLEGEYPMSKETRNKPTTKPTLPPDPDNMNDDRAAWADVCIHLMSELTGCEPGQEALGDLMCNLFHWGDRNGITPDEMVNLFMSRKRMYHDETMPLPEDN
jgi:hypothetical protein